MSAPADEPKERIMARRLLFFLAVSLLMSPAAVRAQTGSMTPEFGIKAGANFSDIDTNDLGSSTRTGLGAGVYLDLATPLLHLQPEALFMTRGFKNAALTATHDFDYRRYDLEIPALIVFSLPLPAVSPRAFAGPAYSIPLKTKIKTADGWYDINNDAKNSWSLIVGAGAKFLGTLGVELRYDIGLSAVNDRPLSDILEDIDSQLTDGEAVRNIKDRTFTFMVSFALN
jgi:hypothetical protein